MVFGGDGTMLRMIRETNGSGTPILGIKMGRLGFLTALSSRDFADGLEKVWRNDFLIGIAAFDGSHRAMQGPGHPNDGA